MDHCYVWFALPTVLAMMSHQWSLWRRQIPAERVQFYQDKAHKKNQAPVAPITVAPTQVPTLSIPSDNTLAMAPLPRPKKITGNLCT